MKKLIINADDFGLTESVNKAIIDAHKNGILTSCTLMCNGLAFEEAVELAKYNTTLGVGIHLTLVKEKPISPAKRIPSLINNEGQLLNRSELIRRILSGKISLVHVENELDAQIEKFIISGLNPTHIDSHQHTHILPKIVDVVVKLAKKLGVPVRVPNEKLVLSKMSFSSIISKDIFPLFSKIPMKLMCRKLKRICDKYLLKTNDHFLSIFGLIPWEKPNINHFELLFSYVKYGITELMVHPAYYDELLTSFWKGGKTKIIEREQELLCLLDPKMKLMLKEKGIHLINYASLMNE